MFDFLKNLFKLLLVLYVLVCVLAFFFQSKFILHPHALNESKKFRAGEEVEIPIDEDLFMNCLHVKAQPSKGVVLYFHGNTGNVGRALYQSRLVFDMGYDLFIPDYRGFGKTEGEAWSDKELLSDANKAYEYLLTKYDEKNIYVMGYSLGTGMASYVTSKHNPQHLFLVAPFTSLTDIKNQYAWFLPDFLMRINLPNERFLADVSTPVSIIHGTNDNIVNYRFSKQLKEKFPDKVKLITSENQSHRGVIFDPLLRKELKSILGRG